MTSFLFSGYGSAGGFFCFFFENRKKFIYFTEIIFILSSEVTILASLILKQGIQGLQVLAFCILTINDEHTKQT